MTDTDLLARLRSGDHSAFDAIFREWYPPVVRAANRILHEPGVAEELAQDVFLELWRRRDQLPEGSSVPGYLLQAARNRALNHLRRPEPSFGRINFPAPAGKSSRRSMPMPMPTPPNWPGPSTMRLPSSRPAPAKCS